MRRPRRRARGRSRSRERRGRSRAEAKRALASRARPGWLCRCRRRRTARRRTAAAMAAASRCSGWTLRPASATKKRTVRSARTAPGRRRCFPCRSLRSRPQPAPQRRQRRRGAVPLRGRRGCCGHRAATKRSRRSWQPRHCSCPARLPLQALPQRSLRRARPRACPRACPRAWRLAARARTQRACRLTWRLQRRTCCCQRRSVTSALRSRCWRLNPPPPPLPLPLPLRHRGWLRRPARTRPAAATAARRSVAVRPPATAAGTATRTQQQGSRCQTASARLRRRQRQQRRCWPRQSQSQRYRWLGRRQHRKRRRQWRRKLHPMAVAQRGHCRSQAAARGRPARCSERRMRHAACFCPPPASHLTACPFTAASPAWPAAPFTAASPAWPAAPASSRWPGRRALAGGQGRAHWQRRRRVPCALRQWMGSGRPVWPSRRPSRGCRWACLAPGNDCRSRTA